MSKTRIAIIYGGQSVEHEISRDSAVSIAKALDPAKYLIQLVCVDKQGHWWLNQFDKSPLQFNELKEKMVNPIAITPLSYFKDAKQVDVAFPIIHGTHGEDGVLQGLLELANIAYVGNNVLVSSLAMDKDMTKRVLATDEIPSVPYFSMTSAQWSAQAKEIIDATCEQFSFSLFVKPANTGSSVGIHKVKAKAELKPAIDDAFRYDTKVLIEQGICGREVEVAVLENRNEGELPLVSVPGEIKTQHEFYSYEAKYHDPNVEIIIPAELTSAQVEALQNLAQRIFILLGCEGLARIDFFIEEESGQIYFNELNTLPGFTAVSMYPLAWQASGLSYTNLLDELIALAQRRHIRQKQLKRTL